jgi:hypothetical protein
VRLRAAGRKTAPRLTSGPEQSVNPSKILQQIASETTRARTRAGERDQVQILQIAGYSFGRTGHNRSITEQAEDRRLRHRH